MEKDVIDMLTNSLGLETGSVPTHYGASEALAAQRIRVS